jgi:hypothetical protein
MKIDELRNQVYAEFTNIDIILAEIDQLVPVLKASDCSTRNKAAASAFLSQCYTGIENILKRILVYCGEQRPSGSDWHIELVKLFSSACRPKTTIPELFNEELLHEFSGLRRLRHFVMHGYSFSLDREILYDAACRVRKLMDSFQNSVKRYIHSEEDKPIGKI